MSVRCSTAAPGLVCCLVTHWCQRVRDYLLPSTLLPLHFPIFPSSSSIILLIVTVSPEEKLSFLHSLPTWRFRKGPNILLSLSITPCSPNTCFFPLQCGNQDRWQKKREFLSDADLFLLTIPTERRRRKWRRVRGNTSTESIATLDCISGGVILLISSNQINVFSNQTPVILFFKFNLTYSGTLMCCQHRFTTLPCSVKSWYCSIWGIPPCAVRQTDQANHSRAWKNVSLHVYMYELCSQYD